MELEDGLDDLLAEISEPISPKKAKLDIEVPQAQPGMSHVELYLFYHNLTFRLDAI